MSFPGNFNPNTETVNLPFAQSRDVNFGHLSLTPDSSMSAALNSSTGTFAFVTNGTPVSQDFPLAIQLIYSSGGPYDITSYSGFILGFSQLSGMGNLYMEVGSSDGTVGEHRLRLTGPGDVFYSVADIKPNSIHTVDSFNILRFIFEAQSPQFSFTLDEIRLVPEPSKTGLVLCAGGLLLSRRSRMVPA